MAEAGRFRRFILFRREGELDAPDGVIAYGALFPNGKVAVCSDKDGTIGYFPSVENAKALYDAYGETLVCYVDGEPVGVGK